MMYTNEPSPGVVIERPMRRSNHRANRLRELHTMLNLELKRIFTTPLALLEADAAAAAGGAAGAAAAAASSEADRRANKRFIGCAATPGCKGVFAAESHLISCS